MAEHGSDPGDNHALACLTNPVTDEEKRLKELYDCIVVCYKNAGFEVKQGRFTTTKMVPIDKGGRK